MIVELKNNEFFKVMHMLNHNLINLEIKSVVYNINPGWIFVDDPNSPQTAMVWSKGIGGFYFIGKEDNELFNRHINNFIDTQIVPRAEAEGLTSFEFSGTSPKWDERLELLFEYRKLAKSKQYVYKNSLSESSEVYNNLREKFLLNEDYVLKKVDKNLFAEEAYDISFVEEAVLEWWSSIDLFMKNGIGYCILHNNKAVCSCVTSFMTAEEMESHISTKEDHRKRGLATVAVSEFVNEAKKKNFKLHWDCMENNHGSRALAEKHKFCKAYEYTLFEFDF